jgi:GTP-binding protein
VLFSSRADQLPDSYRRYLVNSMRESFDLPGVPIRISMKSNKNPYAEGEDGSPPTRTPPAFMRRSSPAAKAKAAADKASGKPSSKFGGKPVAKLVVRKPGGRGAGAKGQSKPSRKVSYKTPRGRPSSR